MNLNKSYINVVSFFILASLYCCSRSGFAVEYVLDYLITSLDLP